MGYDNLPCALPQPSLPALISEAIIDNWDLDAFTDYKGATLKFSDVAQRIARLHILFEKADIQAGDRIAICGRNSSNWAVACLATMTYGAVVVPILHEFKPDNIHHIVSHSEARLFFAGDQIWENLEEESMPGLDGVIVLDRMEVVFSRKEALSNAGGNLDALFDERYPQGVTKAQVSYPDCKPEDLCMINYTSGSTGFSKGVMLPYRSILNNRVFSSKAMYSFQAGYRVVSMLPMAHMYGFSFEFFYEFTRGCHIYFLTRTPNPVEVSLDLRDHRMGTVALALDNTHGSTMLYNNTLVDEDGAVPQWVSISPERGYVPSASTDSVMLTFTTYNCTVGDYYADLQLVHSGEDMVIPIIMHVSEESGIAEHNEPQQVLLYPNPTTGTFHIKNEASAFSSISCYDVFGRLIFTKNIDSPTTSIDMGSFPSGIYLIKMEDHNGGCHTEKLIKK